jgi:Tol biopolymer transport system component
LTRIQVPDEHGAEQRSWEVVRSAYRERVPAPERRPYGRPALAFAAAVLAGAVALSPAGATVGRLITRALGVQHAAAALSSLPVPGRLLVSGPDGAWTVAANGSTRRLGPWPQASWSPHGRYIAVASVNRLAAVDPHGKTYWKLVRPHVSDPRWYPPLGYRVAYLSGHTLRVVAGDGTGDHLLASGVARIAPAWRPAHPYELSYVTQRGAVRVLQADTGRALWSATSGEAVEALAWSADGQRLLTLSPTVARVYSADGSPLSTLELPGATRAINGVLSPDGQTLAVILDNGGSDVVALEDLGAHGASPRRVLAGAGLGQLLWSPDGRWLLVSWPAADQWVFVRVTGAPRIAAVSHIARQFSTRANHGLPNVDGWCCGP